MADVGKDVGKHAEKELQVILREEAILPKLRKAVEKRDLKEARVFANRMGYFERRLVRRHKRLMEDIEDLEEILPEGYKEKLDDLKNRLRVFANDVLKEISRRKGEIPAELKKDKPNWESIMSEIDKMDKDFKGWIALEKELGGLTKKITTAEVYKYPTVPAASREKIMDLLRGKGKYAAYSHEQRRGLWNRWVTVTTQRVLKGMDLRRADLSEFNFEGFVFKDVNLENTNLSGADLTRATLRKANLERADLTKAALWGATLQKANLNGATLEGANLTRTTLWGATLNGANLKGATIQEAILRGAYLNGANLEGADLEGADLTRATLNGANLMYANLTGAKLEGATLNGANLMYANLRDIRYLTLDQLHSAKNWEKANDIPTRLKAV